MSEPKQSPKKKIILFLLLIGVVGYVIKQLYFKPEFQFAGTLEATKVDISSQVATTIQKINVQEGDHVTQHQLLIVLAGEDIKVVSKLANENFKRNHDLFQTGTASQESLDQVKSKKDEADVRLGWCQIQSPIQGIVLNRYHEPGEWVSPGTKLLTLANIQDIWAYIYVPQTQVSRLKVGMSVTGRLPELNNRSFLGKIVKINEEAEFTPKNVQTQAERTRLVFGVKISFTGENSEEILKPGMTLEIKLP